MLRVSIPWMLNVSSAMERLDLVSAGPLQNSWYILFNANAQLEALFDLSIYRPHLRISREKATQLRDAIQAVLAGQTDATRQISEAERLRIQYATNDFRSVFLSEIGVLPVFLASEKEGYDLHVLIDSGERLFPSDLLQKAPEAMEDCRQAGKALAYELATACGFHVFRVTESVLKRYWDYMSRKQRPNLETLGNYAAELEKGSFGEAKIWESIKQMTKLHRNPLIHPEVLLTVEEAIGIVGIARSVVGAMLYVLPDVPPTTGAISQVKSTP